MFKKIALCLCFTLFLGLLSACSPTGLLHLNQDESNAKKSSKTNTENTSENSLNSQKSAEKTPPSEDLNLRDGIGAPVALPPSFGQTPTPPGESGSAFMPNGLPALQPMKGINVDEMFSEKIKSENDRFDRLENAVRDMRREFESVKPSIVRLAAVEADIQSLVKEMETMLQETPNPHNSASGQPDAMLQIDQLNPQPAPPTESPENDAFAEASLPIPAESNASEMPQALANDNGNGSEHVLKLPPHYDGTTSNAQEVPPPPKEHKTAPPKAEEKKEPSYEGIVAKNIRLGEHDDKIRVVFDTNQKTPFSIELDNEEKLIVVELPEARWVGPKTQKMSNSTLIESYSVDETNGGKGSMIVFTLKHNTEILMKHSLLPDGNQGHRIYFDVKL